MRSLAPRKPWARRSPSAGSAGRRSALRSNAKTARRARTGDGEARAPRTWARRNLKRLVQERPLPSASERQEAARCVPVQIRGQARRRGHRSSGGIGPSASPSARASRGLLAISTSPSHPLGACRAPLRARPARRATSRATRRALAPRPSSASAQPESVAARKPRRRCARRARARSGAWMRKWRGEPIARAGPKMPPCIAQPCTSTQIALPPLMTGSASCSGEDLGERRAQRVHLGLAAVRGAQADAEPRRARGHCRRADRLARESPRPRSARRDGEGARRRRRGAPAGSACARAAAESDQAAAPAPGSGRSGRSSCRAPGVAGAHQGASAARSASACGRRRRRRVDQPARLGEQRLDDRSAGPARKRTGQSEGFAEGVHQQRHRVRREPGRRPRCRGPPVRARRGRGHRPRAKAPSPVPPARPARPRAPHRHPC